MRFLVFPLYSSLLSKFTSYMAANKVSVTSVCVRACCCLSTCSLFSPDGCSARRLNDSCMHRGPPFPLHRPLAASLRLGGEPAFDEKRVQEKEITLVFTFRLTYVIFSVFDIRENLFTSIASIHHHVRASLVSRTLR
jgi:hypothetical protein